MTDQEHKELSIAGLKQAKKILDKLGIEFYLTLGTALGAYRDKDFCGGDIDDIDLNVNQLDYPRIAEIEKDFLANGWELKMKWEADDKISTELSFRKMYENDTVQVKVDLWFMTENPDNSEETLFRMYRTPEEYHTYRLPKRFYEKTIPIEFFGTEYLIPEDIEGYLEWNYGKDWETPIHRDNWDYYTANKSPQRYSVDKLPTIISTGKSDIGGIGEWKVKD